MAREFFRICNLFNLNVLRIRDQAQNFLERVKKFEKQAIQREILSGKNRLSGKRAYKQTILWTIDRL